MLFNAMRDEYQPQITLIARIRIKACGLFFIMKTAGSSSKFVQICEICGKTDDLWAE